MTESVLPMMGRIVYLVRHCQSSGQAPDAPLTEPGHQQAERLADFLAHLGIRRVVSSTYLRARQTIEPLAQRLGLAVETDTRLIERTLASASLPDWQDRIRASFDDLELVLPGGESTATASRRGLQALDEILEHGVLPAVVVAHGNLLAGMLHRIDGRPGFETWTGLTNPDVFRVTPPTGEASSTRWAVERLWVD